MHVLVNWEKEWNKKLSNFLHNYTLEKEYNTIDNNNLNKKKLIKDKLKKLKFLNNLRKQNNLKDINHNHRFCNKEIVN